MEERIDSTLKSFETMLLKPTRFTMRSKSKIIVDDANVPIVICGYLSLNKVTNIANPLYILDIKAWFYHWNLNL